MKDKKAQAWGFDLFVAIGIFLAGIIFFWIYTINYSSSSQDTLIRLQNEANQISDIVLSQGTPTNWTSDNVIRLGILTNGKINQSKLDDFYDLANSDYNKTKSLFRIRENYYVQFQDNVTISGQSRYQIGQNSTDYENLIKVTRVVIYEGNLTTLNVYSWN